MRNSIPTKRFFYKSIFALTVSTALFGLSACGDESTGPDNNATSVVPPPTPTYSSEAQQPLSQGVITTSSDSQQPIASSSSKQQLPPQPVVSSSSKAATQSSEEVLNEPQQNVSGTCGPKTPIIEKGGMATWAFYRDAGDVFDAIMAPFVWNFPELNKTLQGNGMNSVNVSYEQSGTYTATLNVDGNLITCEPLQVQGIPINITSCKADKETAKAGETITWTVVAESESPITGYAWSSDKGTVSGTSTTATMTATADMHKQKVAATVAVTNSDKTTQTYACEAVTVLDPESVDLVLGLGSINDQATYGEEVIPTLPDSVFIVAQTPMTVQIPTGAPSNCTIGCKPKVGSDYMNLQVTWEGEELTGFAYFSPAGCAPGKKYSVTTSVTAICVVNT